ncbi:hypothetical protein B0T17DRAFT_512397 [Bombardia bombarda]|uniref:Uncharacterized protein n=1 Tax=Bombardia bombarda TaxID=252184 RepID=A0AA39T0V3_9PEZI|nr:hypothetical protein B0T17DRAFT_512397 [Bombardia bombarda]
MLRPWGGAVWYGMQPNNSSSTHEVAQHTSNPPGCRTDNGNTEPNSDQGYINYEAELANVVPPVSRLPSSTPGTLSKKQLPARLPPIWHGQKPVKRTAVLHSADTLWCSTNGPRCKVRLSRPAYGAARNYHTLSTADRQARHCFYMNVVSATTQGPVPWKAFRHDETPGPASPSKRSENGSPGTSKTFNPTARAKTRPVDPPRLHGTTRNRSRL